MVTQSCSNPRTSQRKTHADLAWMTRETNHQGGISGRAEFADLVSSTTVMMISAVTLLSSIKDGNCLREDDTVEYFVENFNDNPGYETLGNTYSQAIEVTGGHQNDNADWEARKEEVRKEEEKICNRKSAKKYRDDT